MSSKQVTALGYCKSAALAWLLYDFTLTMADEYTYIWSRRWSTFTLLFFIARYIPLLAVTSSAATSLFANVSPEICDTFQWIEAGCTFVILVSVQIILQFRLYVMYQKSRKVLFWNAALCLIEVGIAVALVVLEFTKTTSLPNSPLVYGSCFSISPKEIAVVLLAPLAYESYLAILAVNRTIQTNRLRHAAGKRTDLMGLLVRDNVVYFLLIAGTLIWVTLVWFFYPVSPGNSLISFTQVSGSIGGTRLIINVRKTALKPHSSSVATSTAGIELPVIDSRRKHRSFHITQGPSFGNINGIIDDLDEEANPHSAVEDDDHYLVSPVDYGRDRPSIRDSGVHVDQWTNSGRRNGAAKVLEVQRSIP